MKLYQKIVWVSLAPIVLSCSVTCAKASAEDMYDMAVLYNSTQIQISDINFSKIAEFYGLRCKRIDLSKMELQDNLLRDNTGDYFKGIAASVYTLESGILDTRELNTLKQAIDIGGLNLLIYDVCEDNVLGHHAIIGKLIDEQAIDVTKPVDSTKDYIVSDKFPEITKEFNGVKLEYPGIQEDFSISFKTEVSNFDIIMSSTDDSLREYPIFIRCKKDKGSIFLLAIKENKSLEEIQMLELYSPRYFSQIVPVMMFVRYLGGDECWHRDIDYANLTIDDPRLTEPYGCLNFKKLLAEMKKHNFHTTIAFIPWNYDNSQPEVVKLFLDNPDRYSLVVHGNNHDHYEFNEMVPLDEQEKDILEALNRMEEYKRLTNIPYGKVMVFPHAICPTETFKLLKKYNFNMTVNAQDIPLGATRPKDYVHGMEPANMGYANFASVQRWSVQGDEIWTFTLSESRVDTDPYVFDLFVDKPILLFTHQDYFSSGIDRFNTTAKAINDLVGEVKWRSLGDIAKHLYLEKLNDDGSIEVKMYSNELVLSNNTDCPKLYHICKEETLNTPIAKVIIDGEEVDYIVEEGVLKIDRIILANNSIEVKIIYTEEIPQVAKFPTGLFSGLRKSGIRIYFLRFASEFRDRYLSATKPGRAFVSLYYNHRYLALGIVGVCGILLISPFMVVVKLWSRKKR